MTSKIREKLTRKEKCQLLSGKNIWNTADFPDKGVPAITLHDGPHGVRIVGVENTIYPNLCLLACSFDKNAVFTIGKMIGNDCVKNHTDVLLAPGVNLKRTVTGGRNFEYFSEDHLLSGELACAYVNGVQSTGTSTTVKHFCCNNQENYRFSTSCEVDEDVLFNTYFLPFKRVIEKAKPDCVMTSYNLVNGLRTNESEYLQRKVLREKFGFDGVIMSDWGAVVDRVKAVKGGCDLEMPGNPEKANELYDALVNGEVDESIVDESVDRILKLVDKHATTNKTAVDFDTEEIVSNIVAESVVMLKNDGVLPLNKGEKIGLYGDGATLPLIQGGGCAQIKIDSLESPYSVLSKALDVVVVPTGGDLSPLKKVDKVIAFLSGGSADSEAFDRDDIEIKEQERKDLEKIRSICDSVCAVLQGGGAFNVSNLPCKALIASYYGGQYYSKGLAKVLCGKSPSGRLAETFPLKLENSPAYLGQAKKDKTEYMEGNFIGYKYYDKKRVEVAFPFGYGLSYTDFKYDNFMLENQTVKTGGKIKGRFTLENLGGVSAKEVIQIYYQNKEIKRLVYFDKIELNANEKKVVEFEIDANEFVVYKNGEYVLPNEKGVLSVSKNALDDIYSAEISLVDNAKITIDDNMLIEDLVELIGVKAVSKIFSKAIGCALFSDENYVLPAENGRLADDEFVNKSAMMMPIKNLASFSWKFTKKDLDQTLKQAQTYLDDLAKNINE